MRQQTEHLYTSNHYNSLVINSLTAVDTAGNSVRGGVCCRKNLCSPRHPNQDIFEKAEKQEKEFKRKQNLSFLNDKRTSLHRQVEKGFIYSKFAEQSSFTLDDFDAEFLINQAVSNVQGRVAYDKEKHYKLAVCENCGEVAKRKAVALHSFCRYSSDEGNVKAMISKNKKKLKTCLRSVGRIKEFVISFPAHPAYFRAAKSSYEKIINLLFKELRKINIDFPTLQVIDFKINDTIVAEIEPKLWQVHFHFVAPNLEQNNFDVRVWHKIRKEIISKTGQEFTISFGKYKSKRRVIGYFALMMSGRYTAQDKHHGVSLDKIIDEKEYLLNFFGMRSFSIRGHRGQKIINFDKGYYEWLCSNTCLSIPKTCPFCHSDKIILLTEAQFEKREHPPPQNQLNFWQEKAILLEATNPALAQAYKERGEFEWKQRLIKQIQSEDNLRDRDDEA